jgi:hypothetical protein
MSSPISEAAEIGGKAGIGFPFKNRLWITKAAISPINEKAATRIELQNP